MAGYAPEDSSHSRALDRFRRRLEEIAPDIVVEIVWDIVDMGRPVGDLIGLVERGDFTLCYLSTSYLTDRVPELALVDTPYRFEDLASAHRTLDGAAGRILSAATSKATGLEVLGYWDNGFRHLTNRLREVRHPEDCSGMRVRVQPSVIHERMIELWGAVPVATDLKDGIDLIASGGVDAQENPLANTVAYGIQAHHRHISLTGHVYGARGLYANRDAVRGWSSVSRRAINEALGDAIAWQRIAAAEEETAILNSLRRDGVEVVELTDAERADFSEALTPLRADVDASLPQGLLEAVT